MDILVVFALYGIMFSYIGIIAVKVIKYKKLPESNYTPFDYITAQSNIEFHEEKEEKEEEADKGDDKNKNSK